MTQSEYQQLVEFIAPKFDQIDKRFDAVDKRFDAVDERFDAVDERFDRVESRLTGVEVYAEVNRQLIQTVAEGVQANSQKLDAFKAEVIAEFAAVRSEMAEGFASVHDAVSGLEGRVSSLEALRT